MYNPFIRNYQEVPLSELNLSDIEALVNSNNGESIYLEFKQSFDENVKRKIPALISSFANEQGGYVIIGIKDGSKEIIGIEKADYEQIIGNIIKAKISPFIAISTKYISIDELLGILVIEIQQGIDSPYVVDGIIYRRIGSNSIGLIQAKDRYDLEIMLKRRKETYNSFKKFCSRKIDINDKEWIFPKYALKGYYKYNSLCDIYLMLPDVSYNERLNITNCESVRKIHEKFEATHRIVSLDEKLNMTMQMPFPRLSYSQNSIVLRNTMDEEFRKKTVIWQMFGNGWSKIHFVINEYSIEEYIANTNISREKSATLENYRILDGEQLLKMIFGVLGIYQSIIGEYFPKQKRYIINIRVSNVMNRILYIGGKSYNEYLNKNSIMFSEQPKYTTNRRSISDNLPIDWETIMFYLTQVVSFFGLPPVEGLAMFLDKINTK